MTTEFKRKDAELYDTWKKTGDKASLGQLIHQLSPLIYSEVKRQSGTLPNAALSAEAKRWAIKAIESYDPTKGASLSTHVVGYLPKVRRLNYKHQNVVRLPENLQLKYHQYNQVLTNLKEDLNRDPSDEELASKLGWSKPATIRYRKSLFQDLLESGNERPLETNQFDQNKILFEHIRNNMTKEEKIIMDNVKVKNSTELAEMLGVNVNKLNYMKSKLIKKIKDEKTAIGMT